MRAKSPRLIITFATNSDAMAMESEARAEDWPGRLVPVPSDIDAGCGLAWCAEPQERDSLLQLMQDHGLALEASFLVEMY